MNPSPEDPLLLRFTRRYFVLIASVLFAILFATQLGSALQESATNDEPVHITSGYVYLTTGEYTMDLTHPPLGRILAALPLLPLHLKHISAPEAWDEYKNMIWANQIPAEAILIRTRLVTIALTFLFGAYFAWWTRRRLGPRVALFALTFFVFDPTLIAHGHYVTTDLIASFAIFLTCTLWADFLDAPGWTRLAVTGLACGVAVASKYSALFLGLVLPGVYAIAYWRNRGRKFFTPRGAVAMLLVLAGIAAAIVVISYVPDIASRIDAPLEPAPRNPDYANGPIKAPDNVLFQFGYFRGLYELALLSARGHPAYLLANFSRRGWWNYFPIAFLVKTSTAVLLACALAVFTLCRLSLRSLRLPTLLLCLAMPPLVYFALAMLSSLNLGVRHILPVYPFLYVLLAYVLIERAPCVLGSAWRWTLPGLLLLAAVESLSIYPNYLAFFNWPSGGPLNGSRYLLDSNIDWGQDTKSVAAYVKEHHLMPLCTALFGPAPAAYFGITARDLNQTGMPEGVENLRCAVAVSVNVLRGLYNAPEKYRALWSRDPVARIGYSVYIYDLRRETRPDPQESLSR